MSRSVKQLAINAAVVSGTILFAAALSGCDRTQSTETLMLEAQQYQQKGDIKAAQIQLKNAVLKSPENAEARFALGALYLEIGDMVSAEKELRKALSLGGSPAKMLPPLAKALLAQGQPQKALDETAAEGVKNAPELLVLRGDAYLLLNKAAEAKTAFETTIAAKPGHPDALVGLARHSLSQNDLAAAVLYSDQAVAKNPDHPAALLFKADLLRVQGKTDAALAAYDQLLAKKPDHRTARLDKAYLEIGLKKYDAAKADIDAARKSAPGSLPVLYAQALLDYNQEKHASAREGLQKVLRAAPDHMPSILLAGAVEYSLGSMPQAEQHLKKYLEKNPANTYARKLMATTLMRAGRPTEALETLAPAMKDAQQDPQLLGLAGQANLQNREFDKAADYFEKASALAPQEAKLHTALALSKLGQGDDARAISELQLSTKLDSKLSQTGVVLAMTELRLKHYDRALAAAAALEKEQPADPMVHNLKGGILLSMKDLPAARASFEKALALQPTYFPAVANLAQIALYEKKPEVAKKHFETLLEKDKKNIEAMTSLASLAVAQGQPAEATVWLERAVNENPEAIGPSTRLTSHYMKNGDKQKALTQARKLAAANPANAEVLDVLAQSQLANGDQAGAIETYSKLVAVVPKSAPARTRLAAVHMAMKNETAAAQDLKRALSLQPDYLPAQLAQAELALRANQPEQALAIARQIQKQGPGAPIGYGFEGDLMLAQKKPELALQAFEKAFALNPTPALMIKLHSTMSQSGKQVQADARMARWQKEHPADSLSAMYLGELELARKQFKKAIPHLEAVAVRDPRNAAALNNLAWAYHQQNDPRALATAEKANQLAGQNPAVIDTLGWLLVEQGDTVRGVPLLRKAAGMAPKALDIRFHLASALSRTGDKAGARKELEPVLAAGAAFGEIDAARALHKQL